MVPSLEGIVTVMWHCCKSRTVPSIGDWYSDGAVLGV